MRRRRRSYDPGCVDVLLMLASMAALLWFLSKWIGGQV